jgi:hypothetical protein
VIEVWHVGAMAILVALVRNFDSQFLCIGFLRSGRSNHAEAFCKTENLFVCILYQIWAFLGPVGSIRDIFGQHSKSSSYLVAPRPGEPCLAIADVVVLRLTGS